MNFLLIDDHVLFLAGIEKILTDQYPDCKLSSFKSIKALKEGVSNLKDYDILITDIELPDENIFDLIEEFRAVNPTHPILVISMHNKLSVLRKCKYDLGVQGYILKEDKVALKTVIEKLFNGEHYYSEKTLETLSILNQNELFLTPKEEEVIKLLALGKSNTEIADMLFISYNTVKTHRKNINRKLNLRNAVDIVKYYYENYIH